jgi:hypothetical protein
METAQAIQTTQTRRSSLSGLCEGIIVLGIAGVTVERAVR